MKTPSDIPVLQEQIVQKKAENSASKASIGIYEKGIKDLNAELSKMRKENPAVAQREKVESSIFGWKFLGVLLFLLAAGGLISLFWTYQQILVLILTVVAAAALIFFGVKLYAKHKVHLPALEKLNQELKDYDAVVDGINKKIKSFNKEIDVLKKNIRKNEEDIEALELDVKLAPFGKNYAIVFVGERHSSEDKFTRIMNKIYIDDEDMGTADFPFKVIRMEPGMHTIKAVIRVYYGEEYHYPESEVIQFRADDSSKLFAFYLNREPRVSARTFYEFKDFFDFTKQKPEF